MNDIGTKLKWLFKNKGIKQKEIAAKLGLKEGTFSRQVRTGTVTIKNLKTICKLLDVPVSRLVADDTDTLVEITPEERELINVFQSLPPEKKLKVLKILKDLRDF